MKKMDGNQVRSVFLKYFGEHGHKIVPSYPLVAHGDSTLLFTNAGMVQFKDIFTGARKVDYSRATSSQKCLRVSGKHNDLENVGRTPRHHTFFEMLGNFSFGDYFKEGAIRYAWELMTEGYGLPPERLLITVFREDDEAFAIWRDLIGVPAERIRRHDEKDNFWAMGPTGPCGPCSELHWDRGPAYGPDPDDRYMEIWNLVFMQYERTSDGVMHPLPRPSIDTGAGLERLAAVLQGVHSNYDTDLFRSIIARIEQVSRKQYGSRADVDTSLRVIADHARATTFLIADGIFPENEDRGYVLRRIMRRAIRHGTLLGLDELFFHEACLAVVELFGEHYPELRDASPAIIRTVQQEEEQFRRTLSRGMDLINSWLQGPERAPVMPGDLAFRLYDTYGFPLDLTEVIGEEQRFTVDRAGFEDAMDVQRKAGRASWKGAHADTTASYDALRERFGETVFQGYTTEALTEEPVLALLIDGQEVELAAAGQEVELITAATPFYAEAGGQVGDTGLIQGPNLSLEVTACYRPVAGLSVHRGRISGGTVIRGERVTLSVDHERRSAIRRNHSATHLLHHALRAVLGNHVRQKGSLVTPDRLRFDFAHFQPITPEELAAVEKLANELVLANDEAETQVMEFDAALKTGAMAFFEEKYGERVRVLRIGRSTELCGGTHVRRSGDIGLVRIVAESGIAAGVRRIEAVTGLGAVAQVRETQTILDRLTGLLRVTPAEMPDRVERIHRQIKELEKEVAGLKSKVAASSLDEILASAISIGGARIIARQVEGLDQDGLMALGDRLREALRSGALLLALPGDDRVQLLCMVTADLVPKLHAGNMIRELARLAGGGGGGAPHMAKAGGKDPSAIPLVLKRFHELVQGVLLG